MMTPRPLAAMALLASSAPLAVATAPAAGQASAPSARNDGLYALFPASPEAEELATDFYAAYGVQVPVEALRRGTFPDKPVVKTAPPAKDDASVRAGVGIAASAAKVGLLAALAAAILAIALAAMATLGTSTARAAVPADFKGVIAEDVYIGSDAYQAEQLTKIRAVGFTVVRQVFRWPEIQPVPSAFDFSATDRFVLAAAKAKVRVQPILFGEPAWATSRPARNTVRTTFPPKKPADFARFAAAIVLRYGQGGSFWQAHPEVKAYPITAYQLWNEPNLKNYWGNKPNGRAYAAMVKAATPAIRRVQPKAQVISGGIPDSKLGIRAKPYLRTFLKAGGGRYVDAIGIHPYSSSVATVMALSRSARRTLDSVGGRRIGLVVTEIGWATGGIKTPGRTVSTAKQARLVPDVYKAFARSRRSLKLRSVMYFAWRDSPTYPGRSDFWGLRTGLHTIDGAPKPVVARLTTSLKTLR